MTTSHNYDLIKKYYDIISDAEIKASIQCHICPRSFSKSSLLAWHLSSVHFSKELTEKFSEESNPLKCKVCGEEKKKKYNLLTHCSDRHEALKDLVPEDVYCLFKTKQVIYYNYLISQSIHFCKVLTEKFSKESNLLKCKVCGKEKKKKNNLLTHCSDRHDALKDLVPEDVYNLFKTKTVFYYNYLIGQTINFSKELT